jgi:peptidoglycan/xylan/chitin deacetylase (PgdA/CDA1 family)
VLALTFDNLGEAADLERGLWPAGRALGSHPSVTVALPGLLDELDALGLRATFCVEALNCEVYPDAVRGIAARGHELAVHGWRHEAWAALPRHREDELLARGRAAFAGLGIEARGFRPPGGDPTPHTETLLERHGFAWCSPAGAPDGARDRAVARVPFRWSLVDAYHRLESFAERRRARGDPAAPLAPDAAAQRLIGELDDAAGAETLVLHPFLMADGPGFAAARRVLRHVAGGHAPAGPVAAVLALR